MNNMLPKTWRPDMTALLPVNPAISSGPALAWWITLLYLCASTVRSFIHMLAPDGGAHSIATMDVSGTGGANLIAIFGQWGASQLLLALLSWVLLFHYRGLVPLMLLVFMLEPALRAFEGYLKPVITEGVALGVAVNWIVVPILAAAFFLSMCPARSEGGTTKQ